MIFFYCNNNNCVSVIKSVVDRLCSHFDPFLLQSLKKRIVIRRVRNSCNTLVRNYFDLECVVSDHITSINYF